MSLSTSQIVFAAGFVVFFTIRAVYGRHRRKRTIVDIRVDWVEKVLLAAVSVGMLVMPAIYLFSPWLGFADFAAPRWLIWPGGVVMAVSLVLFWRTHVDLGRNWSPSLEIGDDQTLVTRGIYRRIRHPMYASFWLFGIAQIMLLDNWIAGPSTFLPFMLMYLIRLPREEQMMIDRFDDEYRVYIKRTGRIIPRFVR